MKTSIKRGLCLLLVLGAQIFAQRFTAAEPNVYITGNLDYDRVNGYSPFNRQTAALGGKKTAYANLMLMAGPNHPIGVTGDFVETYNIVNSYGNVLGNVQPLTSLHAFKNAAGNDVYDNAIEGVAVLDSINDGKKTATAIFATAKKLIVMEITLNNTNSVSGRILKSIDLPEIMWRMEEGYEYYGKRLALLGTGQSGTDKIYHLAIGSPYIKTGANKNSGRVDFLSLKENSWILIQPNNAGLASGVNGLFFEENTYFGTDLVAVGDLDNNGHSELAVLSQILNPYQQSAIYIFFMDNEWTPSTKPPTILAGNSMPWLETPGLSQRCMGLGHANWNDTNRLLVSCNARPGVISSYPISKGFYIKDIVLDSNGNILNTYLLYKESVLTDLPYIYYNTYTNPLAIGNHKGGLPAVSIPVYIGTTFPLIIFPVIDADLSKNFLLKAGKAETIANLDSLFYKSGTSGFSVNTLFGLVLCGIQNNNLLCEAGENAINSWSALEVSSRSECDPYRECKRKDTIYVYVHSKSDSRNTALRIPTNMVLPFFGQINFNNLESLTRFRNPDLESTEIKWNLNKLKLSAATSNANNISIIPFSQKEGIDTLIFNLSVAGNTDNYHINIHVADTSKILYNAVPKIPGIDTIWNTAQKRYIALPQSNSSGNTYTYDIAQNGLGIYAEIIGDYLHILKVDIAEISIAYTENSQIKNRTITLMPEPPLPVPTQIGTSTFTQNLNAAFVNGGVQIHGLNGELELKAYNFKGMEIQSERAMSQGSIFIKLKQSGPQIVQIKSGNRSLYLKIAR